ncbi:FxLYD domain-containing protein [Streptomyces lincolnensis]|uniref:FxLYD domain-containing protein n=1 Tax=Streptomyces lincolnensis TaxID=1915 RepID=UPI0037D46CB2
MGRIAGFGCLGIVLVLGILIAIGLAVDDGAGEGGRSKDGGSVAEEPVREQDRDPPAPARGGAVGDVKVTKCAVDPVTEWPAAGLLITNRSSKTSDYTVDVEFLDRSGKRLGDGIGATRKLAPGQQADVTAQGLVRITEAITCRVTDVTRYASVT